MAKVPINKKNGTRSDYFWSDTENSEPKNRTVFKQTAEGVKRMKGVTFNSLTKKLKRQ